MVKTVITSNEAPTPGLYSQAILIDPLTHKLLLLSGQTGNDKDLPGEAVVDGGYYEQALQALRNMLAIVMEAGGDASCFVSMQVLLKDSENRRESREEFNAAYGDFFVAQGVRVLPTRSLFWVSEVPLEYPAENTLLEIVGIAAIPR